MEKIATDLKQSEQIAKILPLESADMLWGYWYNGENYCVPNMRPFRDQRDNIPNGYIPAWSLSALMTVLPIKFDWEFKTYEFKMRTDYYSNGEKYYDIGYQSSYGLLLHVDAKDLVDACVEMILKLKEKELL